MNIWYSFFKFWLICANHNKVQVPAVKNSILSFWEIWFFRFETYFCKTSYEKTNLFCDRFLKFSYLTNFTMLKFLTVFLDVPFNFYFYFWFFIYLFIYLFFAFQTEFHFLNLLLFLPRSMAIEMLKWVVLSFEFFWKNILLLVRIFRI